MSRYRSNVNNPKIKIRKTDMTGGKLRKKNKRLTIGLITDWIEQRYQASIYAGIADVLREKDINLLSFVIGSLNEPYEFIAQSNLISHLVSSENVDGLIIMSGTLSNYIHPEELNTFIDSYRILPMTSIALPFEGIPSIVINNKKGIHEVIIHLIKVHGYRRIAFIRGPLKHQEAEERYQAYLDALVEFGIPFNPNLVMNGDFNANSGTRAAEELIKKRKLKPKVDFEALVASNDFMALGALETFTKYNIRVPDEVAVTGFDNIEETTLVLPAMTTIQQPLYEQGRQGAETLLALMAGEKVPMQINLPTTLIIRNSCGCLSQVLQRMIIRETETTVKDCETFFAEKREHIISDMKQALGASSKNLSPEWADQLLDSFIQEIKMESVNHFILVLDKLLHQFVLKDLNVNCWHEVLSIMHHHAHPYLLHDIKSLSEAERIWQSGRILIGEMLYQIKGNQWFLEQKLYDRVSQVNATLMTTFDIPVMMNVIARELPHLNIGACYISLYERDNKIPSDWSRLILAYNKNGRRKLEDNGLRFPSRKLVPDKFLPKNFSYSLAVLPLFYQEDHLGFILFEVQRDVPRIYETLRHQISSSLKGTSLLQERRQAEKELALSNKELEAFTYSLAHDLRAPLRGMNGFSQALLEDYQKKLGEKGRDYLQRIQKASQRMGQLIDGLLQLSRLAQSKIQFKEVDLNSLIESVIKEFEKMDPDRKVEIIVKENLHAKGDKSLLKIMLRCLLDNAWKFTANIKNARIEFGMTNDKDNIIFFIRDNGTGFEMEYVDKLFDTFQCHHRESEGTGIGLALVQRIIQRHGGRIWAEGKINEGATLYFTLA
jgi:DNA-binding LacI/PurR family transcriptional regulator/signal transduction histidine kinase